MRLGAVPSDDGCRFVVWAPEASSVEVAFGPGPELTASAPLAPLGEGHWSAVVQDLQAGTAYGFSLDGADPLPDPASRHQPWGVHGPSAVVDPRQFPWTDAGWRGVAPDSVVYYELHVGTFTPTGTLAAAAAELSRLAELGVTMVELMPLNAFPGTRGWGYDGVFPSAVQASYGGPDGLAAFVDAAHGVGVGVTLDVVYNHFGPEGNVLGCYGPYTTDRYRTPWGAAVNVSDPGSDGVRSFFIDSATRWVTDYHIDGLRLDAVHAIVDPTAFPFLEELVTEVRLAAAAEGRTVVITAESSDNNPALVRPPARGGTGCDAMWNDDFHHALRVSLTGDTRGYYRDYSGTGDLAEAYRHGFVLRGRYSLVRGRRHGRPATEVSPWQLVVFAQNHDQVGNRQEGERLDHHLGPDQRRLAAAAVLLSPFTPLLFMGEEYGETAPFPYFVDHGDPALLAAVRDGRADEFAGFEWEGETPDPGSPTTFVSARLDTGLRGQPGHRELEALYRDLLAVRLAWPALAGGAGWPVVHHSDGLMTLTYPGNGANRGDRLRVVLNVSGADRSMPAGGRMVFSISPGAPGRIAPWGAAVLVG